MAKCTEEVCNSLVEETLDMEIACLVREVLGAQLWQIHKFIKRYTILPYQSLCLEILFCIKRIFLNVVHVLPHVVRWRDVVAVRRQLKRQMRGFPAAPCCVDPRFKLKALVPSAPSCPSMDTLAQGLISLGNAGNMVVSCTR